MCYVWDFLYFLYSEKSCTCIFCMDALVLQGLQKHRITIMSMKCWSPWRRGRGGNTTAHQKRSLMLNQWCSSLNLLNCCVWCVFLYFLWSSNAMKCTFVIKGGKSWGFKNWWQTQQSRYFITLLENAEFVYAIITKEI